MVTNIRRAIVQGGTNEVIINASNGSRPINENTPVNQNPWETCGLWGHRVVMHPEDQETHTRNNKKRPHTTGHLTIVCGRSQCLLHHSMSLLFFGPWRYMKGSQREREKMNWRLKLSFELLLWRRDRRNGSACVAFIYFLEIQRKLLEASFSHFFDLKLYVWQYVWSLNPKMKIF